MAGFYQVRADLKEGDMGASFVNFIFEKCVECIMKATARRQAFDVIMQLQDSAILC